MVEQAIPERPQAVLLDALGTLVELEPPGPRMRMLLAERAGLDVTLDQAWAGVAAEIAYYRSHLHLGRDRASLARLRRGCAVALRDALPPSAATLDLRLLTAILLDALVFVPYPDVAPALEALRRSGVRLVVVTNWDCSVHEMLVATGLRRYVLGAVSSAELGSEKPDPAIFRHALALAGVRPARALHVGDSLDADVGGALAAGIAAVLLARNGEVAPAGVPAIATLAELPALVG